MASLRARLTLLGASAVIAACSPEVLIARSHTSGGASGAETGGAGSSGGGAGGNGGSTPLGAVGGMAEGGAPEPEAARLLADSVADFSLEQGKLGWYYGFDGGSLDSFTLMTKTAVIVAYMPPTGDVWDCWVEEPHWTQIFQLGAHPNGTETSTPSNAILQRAVRRWISDYDGNVIISGELAKIDVVAGSNGVDGSVYVDGTSLYSKTIAGDDGGGLSYEVKTTLHVGSTVDFVLDPHESDDHHDLSRFTGVIARDEPSETQ
jgi:hypothetical protein